MRFGLLDSGKLNSGASRFAKRHVIMRDRDFIDGLLEWSLELDSSAIAERVFAASTADRDQPVASEFPNDSVWIRG